MKDDAAVAEIDNLSKTYRGGVHALRGVSLTARGGEVFGLLGPNGAGKTTIIKSMLGIIRPSGGRATLFGNPAGSTASAQRVGYLPESLRIDAHHTARTALAFYGRLSRLSAGEIRDRCDRLIELVGLTGRDNESVRRFSKGMYQRLGLAQALMHDPDLLILDEPTDGLDPVGRNEVRRVIERLRDEGKTIFLNSHILQEVELVCDRVAVLAAGQLRGLGTIDELRRQWSVDQADKLRIEMVIARSANVSEPDFQPSVPNTDKPLVEDHIFDNQQQLDATIDEYRRRGDSILAIRPRHVTLEQAFMSLVAEASSLS